MATESPSIRNTQLVAAANYNDPTTKLYGPNGSGQFLCAYVSGSRTATLQTSANGRVDGIIQNSPPLGQPVDLLTNGVGKAVAGAAVTTASETRLMVDANGRLITWTATGNKNVVAVAYEDAGAAGDVITVCFGGVNTASAT